MSRLLTMLFFILAGLTASQARAQRQMEKLDRGVIAMRTGANSTFVSWRVLGLEEPSTRYNLYRSTHGEDAVKVNDLPLSRSNFSDTTAPSSSSHTYHVRPLVRGVEQAPSVPFTIAAGGRWESAIRIPLRSLPAHATQFVWVGDLDGDGEYDFVLDRLPTDSGVTQKIEAYTRTGTLLWVVDLGPTSTQTHNIEPGAATISAGHWDGVTVYDFDSDGRAEVALRAADGVVFGDGSTLSGLGADRQAICILDGLTGAERARASIPDDYLADGPLAAHLGVGYLDGIYPSLVASLKNRVGKGAFNHMVVAWDFTTNNSISQRWKWNRTGVDAPDFHQIRLFDVDRNGTDEIHFGGFCLNADGSYRYKVGGNSAGVIHGDRFHLGDFDPARNGHEGFSIQQNNPNGLLYLTFDAATGRTLHAYNRGTVEDTARGTVGDIDPSIPGFEYWAFSGYHRFDSGALVSPQSPYPNFRIWWDGDVLSETLNDGKVEKFHAPTGKTSRLFTVGSTTDRGVAGRTGPRGAPMFYGDILGDWREEIISFNHDFTELIICSSRIPTEVRLYTLAHNPAYRVAMTTKGYMQSHQPDYFIGHGMAPPRPPAIRYTPLILPAARASLGGGVSLKKQGPATYACAVFPPSGGHLEWNRVNGAGGGLRTLHFRYANGAAVARTGQLIINGTAQEILFPSTGGWDKWESLRIQANLKPAASNTVRLASNGKGLAAIEAMAIP